MPPALLPSTATSRDADADAAEIGFVGGCGISNPAPGIVALSDQLGALLDPAGVSVLADDDLLSAVESLEALARRIEALQLAVAAEVEHRTAERVASEALATASGCRNSTELLQRLTRCSARVVRRRVQLGRSVQPRPGFGSDAPPPAFPAVADALGRGELSAETARIVTEMLDRVPPSTDPRSVMIAEQCLVAAATGAPPEPGSAAAEHWDAAESGGLPMHADSMRTMCGVWQQYLDPDGVLPSEEAAFSKRGFRFGAERNGLVRVTGALTTEVAALMGRVFDAVNSPRAGAGAGSGASADIGSGTGAGEHVHDGLRGGIDQAGDEGGDERSADQKRHDALASMLAAVARHPGTPLLGGAPVTVLVQVTADTLDAASSDESSCSGDASTSAKARSRPSQGAETGAWLHGHDGALRAISVRAVQHAACAGATQRITRTAEGRILGIESPQRVFTPHRRRAITLRDGGCIIPGCTVPASWCEIHHVIEHQDGGATHTDNGVLICWYHHRTLNSSGWRIRMIDGIPEVRAPLWVDPEQRWRRPHPPGGPPRRPLARARNGLPAADR